MPESVLDVIHRITYAINGEESLARINNLFQKNGEVIGRNVASISRLEKALSQTTDPAKIQRITKAIDNRRAAINKETETVQRTILTNTKYHNTLKSELGIIGALNQRLADLHSARDKATDVKSLSKYNAEISRLEKERNQMTGIGGKGGGIMAGIGSGIMQGIGIGAGFAVAEGVASAIRGVKQLAVDSYAAAANFEQMGVAFATMTGSKQAGDALIRQIQDFASITPYGTQALVGLSKQLLAYGFQAKEIIPTIDMLGNVAAGVGKDKMGNLIYAFGQIRAAGRLTGQDLLQLINAGFNPLQIISEKTGQSMTKLKEDMGKGLVTFDMVKDAFKTATSEGGKFFNLMQRQSRTSAGKIDAMSDAVDKLKIAMGAGLTKVVGDLAGEFSGLVETITEWITLSPAEEIQKERAQFNGLVQSLIAANKEGANRSMIIQELNLSYPDLINNINLETATNGELLSMLQSVNAQYEARIKIAAAASLADKQTQRNVQSQADVFTYQIKARTALSAAGISSSDIASLDLQNASFDEIQKYANAIGEKLGAGEGGSFFRNVLKYREAAKDLAEGTKEGAKLNRLLEETKEQNSERGVIMQQIAAQDKIIQQAESQLESASSVVPGIAAMRKQAISAARKERARLQKELDELDKLDEAKPKNPNGGDKSPIAKSARRAIIDPLNRVNAIVAEGNPIIEKLKDRIIHFKEMRNDALNDFKELVNSGADKPEIDIKREVRDRIIADIENQIKQREVEIKLEEVKIKIAEYAKIDTEEAKRRLRDELSNKLDIEQQLITLQTRSGAGYTPTKPTAELLPDRILKSINDKEAERKAERKAIVEERKKAAKDAAYAVEDATLSIMQDSLDARIRMIDYELNYRQERLYRFQELAERGNVEALHKEEQRIDTLIKKREEAARRQVQMNAIVRASEMAKAAAESISAIVQSAGGDPYTLAFRVVAAAAAITAGIATVTSAFRNIDTGFYDGGYTGDGGKYDYAGSVHKGEFVFDKEVTARWRPVFESIHEGKLRNPFDLFIPPVNVPIRDGAGGGYRVEKKLDAVIDAVNNISVKADQRMDEYGLMQSVEMVKQKDARRFR